MNAFPFGTNVKSQRGFCHKRLAILPGLQRILPVSGRPRRGFAAIANIIEGWAVTNSAVLGANPMLLP